MAELGSLACYGNVATISPGTGSVSADSEPEATYDALAGEQSVATYRVHRSLQGGCNHE